MSDSSSLFENTLSGSTDALNQLLTEAKNPIDAISHKEINHA